MATLTIRYTGGKWGMWNGSNDLDPQEFVDKQAVKTMAQAMIQGTANLQGQLRQVLVNVDGTQAAQIYQQFFVQCEDLLVGAAGMEGQSIGVNSIANALGQFGKFILDHVDD